LGLMQNMTKLTQLKYKDNDNKTNKN